MSMEERERRQFLVERLQAAILGDDAPEDWREEFLQSMQVELPREFTPEQAVAWNELVALLNDPEFIAAHRSESAPMWKVLEQRGIEIQWWNRSMRDVSERGKEAVRRGESPGSEAAQEIVDDWVALFATVMGQEPIPEFTRNFARMAPAWIEREGQKQRLWELLETLDESGNIAEHQKSERFLVAGLLEKVEREEV